MFPLSLLDLKQTLLILCNNLNYQKMVLEEFALIADHNRCVTRFRFESMIKVIAKLFSYLDESVHYGSHVTSDWLQECFQKCPGLNGLNEYQFMCLWQNQSISFSCYSSVLGLVQRIKESQNIIHDVNCVSCKMSPIQGIRFKCQQCRKLSLCYECFCHGYSNSKHELSHRMYEISSNVS